MKQIRFIMGMPINIEIVDCQAKEIFKTVFDFFRQIDKQFSPYKKNSEVTQINQGRIKPGDYSPQMQQILALSKKTKQQTDGYFDIYNNEVLDPSGLVKGWAILEAAKLILKAGYQNFYIEAGGDIQVSGKNSQGNSWKIGIKNPSNPTEIVKVIALNSAGVATSGCYERGSHIYNPKSGSISGNIVSLTVVGPNVYEADRFATAAFAMGEMGVSFVNSQKELACYAIRKDGRAVYTQNFAKYTN